MHHSNRIAIIVCKLLSPRSNNLLIPIAATNYSTPDKKMKIILIKLIY